jgi:hypothetical protein
MHVDLRKISTFLYIPTKHHVDFHSMCMLIFVFCHVDFCSYVLIFNMQNSLAMVAFFPT